MLAPFHAPHDRHTSHMLHASIRVREGPGNLWFHFRNTRALLFPHHVRLPRFVHLSRLPPPACSRGWRERLGYPSRMPRIYTKTGDDGTTGLLFGGRVSKADPVPEACGTVDEAVALLGLARAMGAPEDLDLLDLQRQLFVVGADLATNPTERSKLRPAVSLVTEDMVEDLEARIDRLVSASPLPVAFVVPGANPASAVLDVARAVIRRAERRVVKLRERGAHVNDAVPRYLNRLSDLLFVLARAGSGGDEPTSRAG